MAHKQLIFSGADRRSIAWHGGVLYLTTSGANPATTTKLVYSHDNEEWYDLEAVTGNGPLSAATMADEPGRFYLAIETDGEAVVVYGRMGGS